MDGLFTKSTLARHKDERSVVRNVSGDVLEKLHPGASEESWMNDPIGSGLTNSQQLLVDWSDWSQHVFLNSAEAKVNLAHDQVINGFPFDGTSSEKLQWKSAISGWTKYYVDQMNSHFGYMNFLGVRESNPGWGENGVSSGGGIYPYIKIKDETGAIGEEIARSRGVVELNRDIHKSGRTIEFWIWPKSSGSATKQTVYQKLGSGGDSKKGETIWVDNHVDNSSVTPPIPDTVNINYMLSSDNFKSIYITHQIEADKWSHIAFVYDRSLSERISIYVNGEYAAKTANEQAELEDILLPSVDGYIGKKGVTHDVYAYNGGTGYVPDTGLYGLLDEFRLWAGIRTGTEIKENYLKNIDSETNLKVCLRFNEPPFASSETTAYNLTAYPYDAYQICLDFSGKSLHGAIYNYNNEIRGRYQNGSAWIEPPLTLEETINNIILFPDWPPSIALNQSFLQSANHYDRNNPNLITNLIPKHYFEDAQFFEGIEESFEAPQGASYHNKTDILPGHAKIPSRVVILTFLLVWANFFDEIKLFLDEFSNLNKVDYDGYDQISPQMILFLADYFGVDLPNPFANEDPSKFMAGQNLKNESGIQTPLSKTVDSIWRRILINLPFLFRSRGTVQGIRALMNTLGIENDGLFRLKEYGGAVTHHITSLRTRKKKRSGFLDFSKIDYLESSPLWAYRWAPGLPDDGDSTNPTRPEPASVDFVSGDISIVTPGQGPVATLFTSGSWSWEARYQLLATEHTASLFRIEKDNDILVNLVAMKNSENALDYNLKLFVEGTKSAYNPTNVQVLEIPGINMWDNSPWYVNVVSEMNENSESRLSVRVIQSNDRYIVEHHSGSIIHDRSYTAGVCSTGDPAHNTETLCTDAGGTWTDYRGPLVKYDSGTPLKFVIGTDPSKTYGTNWLNATSSDSGYDAGPSYAPFSSAKIQGHTTDFSGIISHPRLWTKPVSRNEAMEHAQNPFSVSSKSPVDDFCFPTAKRFPSSVTQPEIDKEGVPLSKWNGTYNGTLPSNSWERLRIHHDMLQPTTTFTTGTLDLVDASQNNDHSYVHATDTGGGSYAEGGYYREDFLFSITPPDFDSNTSSNKIRIRSFQDKELADDNFAFHGNLTELPDILGVDDRRFSIEASLVHTLNEDIINVLGDIDIMNNYLGAPELEYAVDYPEIRKISDIYFQRLLTRVDYNSIIEFQRWFNNNFATLVEQFIPFTADFMGINFVVESHMLERHKMEYKQGDVHVDLYDRMAFSQEPLFYGAIRAEIS